MREPSSETGGLLAFFIACHSIQILQGDAGGEVEADRTTAECGPTPGEAEPRPAAFN